MGSNNTVKKLFMLTILGFTGGVIYYFPFIRYVFFDWQNAAMNLTNAQNGLLISAFGVCEVLFFIPSGILADKFSPKKLLILGCVWETAVLFLTAFTFDHGFGFSMFLWILLSIPGCLFWGPLFKEQRAIAGEGDQAFLFGWYYMCNGFTGALLGFIGMKAGTAFGTSDENKFFILTMTIAICMVIATILIALFINEKKMAEMNGVDLNKLQANDFKFSQVGELLRKPALWAFTGVVLGAYCLFTSTSYYSQYLVDVFNVDSSYAKILQIIRQYIFYVMAPVSGIIADKVFKSVSKWFSILFAILEVICISFLFIPDTANANFVSLFSLLPGFFTLMIYGMQMSISKECGIPMVLMGTATGIVSTIGYSSDLWLYAVTGSFLDTMGNAGYKYIFAIITVFCTIGLISAFYVRRKWVASQKQEA